jgi:exosortase
LQRFQFARSGKSAILSCEMSEHAQAEPVDGSAGAPSTGFLDEAMDVWRRLPHKLLFAILLAAWIALFHVYGNATMGYARTSSLFEWARSVLIYRDDQTFAQYIPLIVLVFLWMKRQELATLTPRISWAALFYFAATVALHFIAFRIQQARLSVLAFIFGLHALIGVLWGTAALRKTIFPMCLLFFCVPFGSWADIITFDLRVLVTKVSVGISHTILGIDIARDGTQIFVNGGRAKFDVAPACSGIRSLIAMTLLSVIYTFLYFDTFWRRAILILCALPFAVLGNIVRLVTVIIVSDAFGQDYGMMIENKFGFVTFLVAMLGMMTVGWLIREKKPMRSALVTTAPLEATPV